MISGIDGIIKGNVKPKTLPTQSIHIIYNTVKNYTKNNGNG